MTILHIPIPTNRPPTSAGEIIAEDFLKPLAITQQQLADAMRISRIRLSGILNGRRGITPDTALRLERVLGPSAQFWLNLQMMHDLYEAAHSKNASEIGKLQKLA